jgi:aryl-alcohol dehydrogenase-like predicted oxidoreductase
MKTRTIPAIPRPVSVLGLGAGALGETRHSDESAQALLTRAVDLGITLIDTAPSYGASEERIARFVKGASPDVRARMVLSTKGGYGIEGVADWTPEVLARNIDRSLARLGVEVLDCFFLHSCPIETLRRGDLFRPLEDAKAQGKLRAAGYSGENDALDYAIDCGHFDVVQCSVNPFDQRSATGGALGRAAAKNMAAFGKRPMGNAPWRFPERPEGHYAETYWHRMEAMNVHPHPLGWDETSLRFAAFTPGVTAVLLGTMSVPHLEAAARWIDAGDLPPERRTQLTDRFRACDSDWVGQV